jgi:nucleotide-binding universal stress UspA family protein
VFSCRAGVHADAVYNVSAARRDIQDEERVVYSHILLPTEGSELAEKGVDQGIELARRLGAKLTILTVSEPLPVHIGAAEAAWTAAAAMADYDEHQASAAKALLAKAKAKAEAAGASAETVHMPRSQPADSIVEIAKSRGCDLIVMASHGRRGFRRLILGSQTAEVVARSPVPVLVIPAEASGG